jgi:protocatechuate 3,4-dioxygenase beta subunit
MMLQKIVLIIFVSVAGCGGLVACGNQVETTLPPPQTSTPVPTAETILKQPVVQPTEATQETLPQSEATKAKSNNQPVPTPTSVEESSVPTPEISCDGTLTPAQAEGPFYTPNTPERSNLVEPEMGGIPLLVIGVVLNQNCEPIAGAMLDFWQTDENGAYDNVGYRMRGHQFTDENGNYALETVLPGEYPGRTPHIHVKVFSPNGQELLTSQIYFAGISDQIADGIFRADLLATNLEPEASGRQHVAFNFVVRN